MHPDQITSLVLTPDGNKVLTAGNDKIVRLWNLTSGAKEKDFAGPTLPIASVAVSANGATIAAASADKTLTLWNAADAKVLHKLPMPAGPQAVAFSGDAQSVFVGLTDGAIKHLTMKTPCPFLAPKEPPPLFIVMLAIVVALAIAFAMREPYPK